MYKDIFMHSVFNNKQIVIFSISLLLFYFFSTKVSNNIFYVGDDFTMLYFKDTNYLKSFLFTDSWWRPFKNIFYNYFNLNFYLDAYLIIKVKIFLHILITAIIYFYFYNLSKNANLSLILSILFLIHQSGVMATISIDTVGQQLCTLFGILSFIFTKAFCNKNKLKYLFFALFLTFLSLLSKENGTSFLLINSLVLIFFNSGDRILSFKNQFSKNFIPILLFVFIFLLFLLLRFNLNATWNPSFGNERYSINIVKSIFNLLQYNFSILSPIDNTLIYLILKNLNTYNIFIVLFIGILILYYFLLHFKIKFNKNLLLFLLLFLSSSIPVIFLSHISELYTYHSIFFFCLFLLNILKQNCRYNKIKITLVCLFIIFSSISYFVKLNNVNKNSILSKNLFNYFENLKFEEKNKSTIYFIENKENSTKYSIFKINSIEMFIPRFYVRNKFNFYFLPINDKNFNIYSNGENLKFNPGDGKEFKNLPKKILTDPNLMILFLKAQKNLINIKEVINYYLFQNQCIVVISPINKINNKICNNNSLIKIL